MQKSRTSFITEYSKPLFLSWFQIQAVRALSLEQYCILRGTEIQWITMATNNVICNLSTVVGLVNL
jgi:hypothetical protein